MFTGADPVFPIGGGTDPPNKFSENLYEIENILGRMGSTRQGHSLGSTTGSIDLVG